MGLNKYVPKQGHIVAVTLDPQAGHEQKGRRPAIVVSNDDFSELTRFCKVCPITNRDRGYPLHIGDISDWGCEKTTGFIMIEQEKSIDYNARQVEFIEEAPSKLIEEVLQYINKCY